MHVTIAAVYLSTSLMKPSVDGMKFGGWKPEITGDMLNASVG